MRKKNFTFVYKLEIVIYLNLMSSQQDQFWTLQVLCLARVWSSHCYFNGGSLLFFLLLLICCMTHGLVYSKMLRSNKLTPVWKQNKSNVADSSGYHHYFLVSSMDWDRKGGVTGTSLG